ncbi:hypothetical protein jhhlp_008148 [Lomentospora prolificans]|uniref:Major facilitator superfamily (MFS) profile domain-containing protein n=1 Tax=Lomentospora prolificans TaxID=41688 RepID=A0A2N3MZM2_9PEZI|nr:hypothetical protein jhhlp_008148 [Lomentospora prolificans]
MVLDTQADQSTPLLGDNRQPHNGADASHRRTHPRRRVTYLIPAVIFILTAGLGLPVLPILRIMEDTICRQNLGVPEGDTVDEEDCKGSDTQSTLSMVVAILFMLEAVPAWSMFLLANAQTFPDVRLIWTSTAFHAIGGGLNVMIAMIYSMVADVEPSENLANGLFIAIVSSLSAELVAVAVASRLMRISPWIPYALGLVLIIIGGILIAFLPETLRPSARLEAENEEGPKSEETSIIAILKSRTAKAVRELADSAAILSSYSIVALLLTHLLTGFSVRALAFATQYLSKSLDWSLSDAGSLMSLQVFMNIALYVVILPSASKLLTSPAMPFKLDPVLKDFWLTRLSLISIFIGSLLIAVPTAASIIIGLVVFTLGLGFSALCRVVLTSMVEPQQTGRLYTLIGVLDSVSKLAAGPVLAWLFKTGMNMGDSWVGLPYLGVALLGAVATILAFSVKSSALSTHRHDDAVQTQNSDADAA